MESLPRPTLSPVTHYRIASGNSSDRESSHLLHGLLRQRRSERIRADARPFARPLHRARNEIPWCWGDDTRVGQWICLHLVGRRRGQARSPHRTRVTAGSSHLRPFTPSRDPPGARSCHQPGWQFVSTCPTKPRHGDGEDWLSHPKSWACRYRQYWPRI